MYEVKCAYGHYEVWHNGQCVCSEDTEPEAYTTACTLEEDEEVTSPQ